MLRPAAAADLGRPSWSRLLRLDSWPARAVRFVVLLDTFAGELTVGEIQRARELLEQERKAVLEGLSEAGNEARELAQRRKRWRDEVSTFLERGRQAGVSVTEMASALGLSRQWTSHLLARRDADARERVLTEVSRRGKPKPPPRL
jgi:hypothetical protein